MAAGHNPWVNKRVLRIEPEFDDPDVTEHEWTVSDILHAAEARQVEYMVRALNAYPKLLNIAGWSRQVMDILETEPEALPYLLTDDLTPGKYLRDALDAAAN